jgi:hypothetical protein
MALAYLRYEESDGDQNHFSIDIGSNRYYAWAVGDADETIRRNGLQFIKDPITVSDLFGPLEPYDLGKAQIEVPHSAFDRRNRAIQLMSFRTARREGPAVSEVVTVPLGDEDSGELPDISFARSSPMTYQQSGHPHRAQAFRAQMPVETIRRPLRERRPLSTAQFLDGLISMLPSILPAAGNLISHLFPQSGGNGRSAPAQPAPSGTGTDLVHLITDLIQRMSAAPGTPAAAAPQAPPQTPLAQPQPAAAQSYSLSNGRHSNGRYSEAQVAPLLAMLPALMPLLQQVLTPQTMQGILQMADPNRLIGTVTNGINQLAQTGLQADQQLMDHLRQLNPGVQDHDLHQLLMSMSASLAKSQRGMKYRRVDSVHLHFADISTLEIDNRPIAVYKRDRNLQFPLNLESPRHIPPGYLKLTIKDASTLKVIAQSKSRTPQFAEGRLSIVPEFPREKLAGMKPGADYLVCADLIWKNKSGQMIGTNKSQLFTIMDEYLPGRVETASGEVIPLNDVHRFRDFWHKAWQGSMDKERARIDFECKYYYTMEVERTQNARVETISTVEETGIRHERGRLKSGLVLSPNVLNELIPAISDKPQLNEAELGALLTPSFQSRCHLAARTKVKFGGRPGTSFALWVFPEVKLFEIELQKVDQISDTGLVLSVTPYTVYFPLPVLVHFVGASSES